MEESNKASDFNKEFTDIIDDLTIDDQVSKIEKTVDHNLSEIKKLVKLLPLIKENSDFNEYSKKLTNLMLSTKTARLLVKLIFSSWQYLKNF